MPGEPTGRFQNREKIKFARQQRKNPTEAERLLWQVIRPTALSGYHFRRQHVIAGYVADFFCHRARLIIELDGPIHDAAEQAEYDRLRDQVLREYRYHILRIPNEEVLADPFAVRDKIINFIKSLG